MRHLRGLSILVLSAALSVAFAAPTAPGAGSPTLFGRTVDALGRVLGDVEILVLSARSGQPPLAVVRSDTSGRFRVRDLAPGVYRIAALKSGYLTYLGEIDTLVQGSLELLLRESGGEDDADREHASPAWALRLPKRNVLRDVDQAIALASGGPSPVGLWPADVELRLDQSFAIGDRGHARADEPATLQGMETRMRLASRLGNRGNIAVQGSRLRLGDQGTSEALERREALDLDVSLSTGGDGDLAVSAFYQRHGSLGLPAPGPAPRPFQRSWGYDAAWSMQIDPLSRVSVRLDYRGAETGIDPFGSAAVPGPTGPTQLLDRRVGASGTYEAVPHDRHQVRVGFRAQFVDVPLRLAIAPSEALPVAGDPLLLGGWSVGVDAEDSFHIAGPWTMVYGLAYRHAWDGRQTTMLLPRIGGAWSNERVSLRAVLAYQAPVRAFEREDTVLGFTPFVPDERIGHEAELELPFGEHLRLVLTNERMPSELEVYDPRPVTAVQPLYLTSGDAESRRSRVALTYEGSRARTSIELVDGEARGNLSAIPVHHAAIPVLGDNRFEYAGGKLGLDLVGAGNELIVEFLRMEERPPLAASTEGYVQDSVELRMFQDVLRLASVDARFRFLLALRFAEIGVRTDTLALLPAGFPADSRSRQIATGLSVSF